MNTLAMDACILDEQDETEFTDYFLSPSRERTYHPCQILSPNKLEIGKRVIVAVEWKNPLNGQVDVERKERTIIDIDWSRERVFFNERPYTHYDGEGNFATFGSLSLKRVDHSGKWNNRDWLEYPRP